MSLPPSKLIPLVLISCISPPIGVLIMAGCGLDLLLNFLLCFLAGIPGILHGIYVLFVYWKRREESASGIVGNKAPFIFSEKVQRGAQRSTLRREKEALRKEKALGAQ